MDQQTPVISTEQSECFENMLQRMNPLLVQGYKKFLHEVIIRGITHQNLTLNTLSSCLLNFNKEAIDSIVEKAISYYDAFAPGDVKSSGI